MQTRFVFRLVGVCALLAVIAAAPAAFAEKIKVENLDDLPRFSYPVEGSVVDVITSDKRFGEFAAAVRTDIEGVLTTYDIKDAATLQDYYRVLARLDLMAGDDDAAAARYAQIRELEQKEAGKLMPGLFADAWIAAATEVDPASDFEAFATVFAGKLGEAAGALPWDVVQDEIKEAKGRAEIFSENVILGLAKSQVDPAVEASGALSSDLVPTVVALRFALMVTVPLNPEVVEVYGSLIAANKVEKENIWYAREYILGIDEGRAPVKVGIWDSGVDVAVFDGQLWTNPSETANGKDSDTNGYIDDIHGIAYDWEGNSLGKVELAAHQDGWFVFRPVSGGRTYVFAAE